MSSHQTQQSKRLFVTAAVLLSLATLCGLMKSSTCVERSLLYGARQSENDKSSDQDADSFYTYGDEDSVMDMIRPVDTFPYPISLDDSDNYNLPLPLNVLHEYIQKHSVTALENDPHPERRKYAIAIYQCPYRAGNNLHRFWNQVLWAILSNRTVLWKYWNKDLCKAYGLKECNQPYNTERDCNEILVRAPWMASYDEWKDRIKRPSQKQTNSSDEEDEPLYLVPDHVTQGPVMYTWRSPRPDGYEKDYGLDIPNKYPQQVVLLPLYPLAFHNFEHKSLQRELLQTYQGRTKVKELYSLGSDFLYGMLYRYTFHFSESIEASVNALLEQDDSQLFTIGLHSRHRYDGLDGCDIEREISCLQRVINKRADKSRPVQVRLMSDRTCTIAELTSWLTRNQYKVVSVPQQESNTTYISEHGPFAGVGFFLDMALVTSSRDAFVGMRRSSSELLRELIVFRQVMQLWKDGVDIYQMDEPGIATMCYLKEVSDPAVSVQRDRTLAVNVNR